MMRARTLVAVALLLLYCLGSEWVYAPPAFVMRTARMRSWRLDLIDASHLSITATATGAAAGAAALNDSQPLPQPLPLPSTAPAVGAGRPRSRLPAECAHLDAYLGVSYSLQFSAPWHVALRAGAAADRATAFVDPFGPHSHRIFNALLRLDCPYHRFAFTAPGGGSAYAYADSDPSDPRIAVDWTDYELVVSTADHNRSVEPYLSPFRVDGLVSQRAHELVVVLVLAPSFFAHYRQPHTWPSHNTCKLKLAVPPLRTAKPDAGAAGVQPRYAFVDAAGRFLEHFASAPVPGVDAPPHPSAAAEALIVADVLPAVRLQMLRVPEHLRHVMYPKAAHTHTHAHGGLPVTGAGAGARKADAYELSDPQFASLLESSVWTFPHRDADGRIRTDVLHTAEAAKPAAGSAGEALMGVQRSVFGMEVTRLDKAMELGFQIGRKYFSIPNGEDEVFLEEDVLLQLNDFLHSDEGVGTATGWILFAIIEGLFPKAIEKGEEILAEIFEKYLIPLEEDLLGGSPVGPDFFLEIDTKITPTARPDQLYAQLSAIQTASHIADAHQHTHAHTQQQPASPAAPAVPDAASTTAPTVGVVSPTDRIPGAAASADGRDGTRSHELLQTMRGTSADTGSGNDESGATVLLEAGAALLAPKGKSKKAGGPGGFGPENSGGRSAIANGPGVLAIAISKDIIKSAPDLYAKISDVMGGMLTVNLHDSIIQAVRDRIAEHVGRATIDTLNAALPVTLTETVPAGIKRLLPSYLMHALEHTLTHTLTRSLTHTVSATLAHTLAISPQREAVCFYCANYQLLLAECRSCLAQTRAQYNSHYYRHHFASYFSDYYTAYYTTGLGKKDGEMDGSKTRP